jgi:hypothetical protein
MEYTISTTQTFQQVTKTLASYLEGEGFAVRRSFDLQSAQGQQTDQEANYCVLVVKPLHTPNPEQATAVLAIYRREQQVILNLPQPKAVLTERQTTGIGPTRLQSVLVELLIEQGWWSMEDKDLSKGGET